MKIAKVTAVPWNVPMRAPYRSAQRVTVTARNVLVTVTLEDGAVGYGESAPAFYVTGETQESVVVALGAFLQRWPGATDAEAFLADAFVALQETPGGHSALVTAVFDASTRSVGIPFCRTWNEAIATYSRQTDLSLPILTPDEARSRASQAAHDGFRALKVKVGSGDATADEARVRAVAQSAPQATLRLDGNQGFGPGEAERFIGSLSDLLPRIELFEQPTKAEDYRSLRYLARKLPIPVFADESAHSPEAADELVSDGIAGIVLKLAKSDPLTTIMIARATFDAGGKCLFGCMMETRIGITAALHIALALGSDIVPILDLDGHLLVNDESLVEGGLTQDGDTLTIDPTAPGLDVRVKTI